MTNLCFPFIKNISSISFLSIDGSGIFITAGILLLIAGILSAMYFTARKYRKVLAYERYEWNERIRFGEQHNENLEKQVGQLKSKLLQLEQAEIAWVEERVQLLQTIKDMEEQLAKKKKDEKPDSDDIVIEYYMNKKSEG